VKLHAGEEGYEPTTSTTSATAACARSGELIQNQIRIGLSRMERVVASA
jgi:hypothetical protein